MSKGESNNEMKTRVEWFDELFIPITELPEAEKRKAWDALKAVCDVLKEELGGS